MKEKRKNHSVVPTRQVEGEDFFYYVGKDDEVEVLEVLGHNQKQSGYLEEDDRVSKFW